MLSLWYIAQLPVYSEGIPVGAGIDLSVNECEFRKELFSEDVPSQIGEDYTALDVGISFRLILLGCMLANKWLDDHTFSNKTWYVDCRLYNESPANFLSLGKVYPTYPFKASIVLS